MTTHTKHISWYLWPFAAIWKLLAGNILKMLSPQRNEEREDLKKESSRSWRLRGSKR